MQPIVTDRPYAFVPPHTGRFWPSLFRLLLKPYMRRAFGITQVEYRGLEPLRSLQKEGHSILLTPNHCRIADPLVMQLLAKELSRPIFIMASSHLFFGGRIKAWVLRRAGAFSVYREGVDRLAIQMAIDLLAEAQRSLVIFPEGYLSQSNDRLNALLPGVSLIARAAAKKQAAAEIENRKLFVVPVAIKYLFRGDLTGELESMLGEIERRQEWKTQPGERDLLGRVFDMGESLLGAKETELLGKPQEGELEERLAGLIDHLLAPIEKEWLNAPAAPLVASRVRDLRRAILPGLIEGDLADEARAEREAQLEDVHLAQRLDLYPTQYVRSKPTVDRILETAHKFFENVTGKEPPHRPTTAVVQVGEPIDTATLPLRKDGEDALLSEVDRQLKGMLSTLEEESPIYREPEGTIGRGSS